MHGTYRIIVQNKRIRYDFEIKRNITLIKGDSATGKTTLVDMISEYYENGEASGIELRCNKECIVLSGRNWKSDIALASNSILFIDEGNDFIFTDEFASIIQKTDNYYVLVTRESIPSLPYSVEEIYGIRSSGRYGTLKQTYNEFYHIYRTENYQSVVKPKLVITEDSNSGYSFFESACSQAGIECSSAGGKSNIFAEVIKTDDIICGGEILIIADGAAFGSEMEKLTQLMKSGKEIVLYLPESFEWLILKSGIIEDREIKQILSSPADYIESSVKSEISPS